MKRQRIIKIIQWLSDEQDIEQPYPINYAQTATDELCEIASHMAKLLQIKIESEIYATV